MRLEKCKERARKIKQETVSLILLHSFLKGVCDVTCWLIRPIIFSREIEGFFYLAIYNVQLFFYVLNF
ncbi:hypothetical protein Pint_05459 [Pistacia integerrima]|uniref:Uncharacterized protein n=3 Tax=Pistacia TaxID=55512 RepID=A0ACC1A564_9ROSI|nr:hypothetical protein Pint_31535 [Pistacia integerrima]KAJ0045687.1 hypothetical protein Pint_05459 [Pistacia integerrima]KAJ0081576.1 hypothetical protein Patl1_11613 [Pistacia atlantica]